MRPFLAHFGVRPPPPPPPPPVSSSSGIPTPPPSSDASCPPPPPPSPPFCTSLCRLLCTRGVPGVHPPHPPHPAIVRPSSTQPGVGLDPVDLLTRSKRWV